MITFTSKTANKEELKNAVWEELIKCTMNAIGPIYGDYERTGFDYSECKSDADKHRKFAISFLEEWTDTNLEISDDGVVLNEDLHTENTCNEGSYDLEALANAIKNKFPDVIIQGEGMIDYHYSAEEYRIYTEDGVIVYEGDGDEGFDEYDEDNEEYDEEDDEYWDQDFSDLTTITIPDSVTSIGDSAFEGCENLTTITIPDSVTSIGKSAFENCSSLTTITIPDSVTSIGEGAFWGCDKLADADGFVIVRGVLYSCHALSEHLVIPDSVTSIGDSAFDGCENLTAITIPEGVISIADYAFGCCENLTTITIPNSVTSIDEDAFYNCEKLTIHAPKGSYAEQYAKENEINFVAE